MVLPVVIAAGATIVGAGIVDKDANSGRGLSWLEKITGTNKESEEDKKAREAHKNSLMDMIGTIGSKLLKAIGMNDEAASKYGSTGLLGGLALLGAGAFGGALAGSATLSVVSGVGLLGFLGYAAINMFSKDGLGNFKPIPGKMPDGGTIQVVPIATQKIKLQDLTVNPPKTSTTVPSPQTGRDGMAMPDTAASELYKKWHAMDDNARMLLNINKPENKDLRQKTQAISVFIEHMHAFGREAHKYNAGDRELLKTKKRTGFGYTDSEAETSTLRAAENVPQMFTRNDGTSFTDLTPTLDANLKRKIEESNHVERKTNKHTQLSEKVTRLEQYILENMREIADRQLVTLKDGKISIGTLTGGFVDEAKSKGAQLMQFNAKMMLGPIGSRLLPAPPPAPDRLSAPEIERRLTLAYANAPDRSDLDILISDQNLGNSGWRGVRDAITEMTTKDQIPEHLKAIMQEMHNYASLKLELQEVQSFERINISDLDKRLREFHKTEFPKYNRAMDAEKIQVEDLQTHKIAMLGGTLATPGKQIWNMAVKDSRNGAAAARTIVFRVDFTDMNNLQVTHIAESKPGVALNEDQFKAVAPFKVTPEQLRSAAPMLAKVNEAEQVLDAKPVPDVKRDVDFGALLKKSGPAFPGFAFKDVPMDMLFSPAAAFGGSGSFDPLMT